MAALMNQHNSVQRPVSDFSRVFILSDWGGMTILGGPLVGQSETDETTQVQSVRFDKEHFTVEEALTWLGEDWRELNQNLTPAMDAKQELSLALDVDDHVPQARIPTSRSA